MSRRAKLSSGLHKPPLERAAFTQLYSILDEVHLSSPSPIALNVDLLADEYASWLSQDTETIPGKTLWILGTSEFQSLISSDFGEEFTKDFQLLIWSTWLYFAAINRTDDTLDGNTISHATFNLKNVIVECGNKVAQALDKLCHYIVISGYSKEFKKQLFLVIIGVSLAVRYFLEENNFPRV